MFGLKGHNSVWNRVSTNELTTLVDKEPCFPTPGCLGLLVDTPQLQGQWAGHRQNLAHQSTAVVHQQAQSGWESQKQYRTMEVEPW